MLCGAGKCAEQVEGENASIYFGVFYFVVKERKRLVVSQSLYCHGASANRNHDANGSTAYDAVFNVTLVSTCADIRVCFGGLAAVGALNLRVARE